MDKRSESDFNRLPVGTMLGDFRITGVIGEGGFGIVYLAHEESLDRDVAVKEYLPTSIAGRSGNLSVSVRSQVNTDAFAAGLKNFLREARMLAKFSHPAMVEVHRVWEQNGTAYMAMRFYDGKTIREHRAEASGFDESQIRRLLDPILDALSLLHDQNVIHRDVSPDNILLRASGAPVLLDLGAARMVVGGMTQALTTVLKPGYAPIEQYVDDGTMPQGPWTDVYGIGAVLYYLIVGHAPPQAVARMITDPMAKTVSTLQTPVSQRMIEAMVKALAVRPHDRFQSIDELREALDWTVPLTQEQRTTIIKTGTASGVAAAATATATATATAPSALTAPTTASLATRPPAQTAPAAAPIPASVAVRPSPAAQKTQPSFAAGTVQAKAPLPADQAQTVLWDRNSGDAFPRKTGSTPDQDETLPLSAIQVNTDTPKNQSLPQINASVPVAAQPKASAPVPFPNPLPTAEPAAARPAAYAEAKGGAAKWIAAAAIAAVVGGLGWFAQKGGASKGESPAPAVAAAGAGAAAAVAPALATADQKPATSATSAPAAPVQAPPAGAKPAVDSKAPAAAATTQPATASPTSPTGTVTKTTEPSDAEIRAKAQQDDAKKRAAKDSEDALAKQREVQERATAKQRADSDELVRARAKQDAEDRAAALARSNAEAEERARRARQEEDERRAARARADAEARAASSAPVYTPPSSPAAPTIRGVNEIANDAMAAFRNGNVESARALWLQLVNHPNATERSKAHAYNNLAASYCQAGDENNCERMYVSALRADRNYSVDAGEQQHPKHKRAYERAHRAVRGTLPTY